MTDESYYLVVNLGLRSNRVIVFDREGTKITEKSRQVSTRVASDRVEQKPEEWWSLTKSLVSAISPEVRTQVGYVTVTSSSCNLVCTGEDGIAVYNSLLVSDKRSTDQADQFSKAEYLDSILEHNNFSASPSYMFPKIAWLDESEPEVFDMTKTFESSNSFLTAKFTGKSVTDYLDAEKFYYSRKHGYPEPLLNDLSLTAEDFPRVVQVGTDIGRIDEEIAAQIGLPSNVHFVVTTYDALAAFWGAGATNVGDGANVCGTCSSLRTAMPGSAELDLEGSNIKAQYFDRPDTLAVGASNSLEGGLLEWAKSTFYEESELEDGALFDKMEAEARRSSSGANGLFFLPYLLGERAPFDDPDARGMFFGMEREHDRSDIIRSIFDSIGFLTRHMIEEIEETGATVRQLKAAGGLTRRDLVCQLKADITGKPVILTNELENTALGCMIISRSTAEDESMQSVADDVVEYGEQFEPNPERHETYSQLYDFFRNLYQSNRENFQERSKLMNSIAGGSEESDHQL